MSDVSEKYRLLDVAEIKVNMTLAEAEALSAELAERMSENPPDLIVGLANGALLPSHIVAADLGIKLEIVRIQREGGRLKKRLLSLKSTIPFSDALMRWKPARGMFLMIEKMIFAQKYKRHKISDDSFAFSVDGLRVAVVDDCMVTGGSVREVKGRLSAAGAAEVTINVLCWHDELREGREPTDEPAVWLHRFVHFYPWSGNSPDQANYRAWLGRRGLEELP